MSASVSVIIPVWNLWNMTRGCLESLAQHTAPGNLEVIVVDNGSTDETAAALEPTGKKLFGQRFRSVRLPQNLGFAKGCNAGAAAASGDLLFFLNNDTVVTENWLPPLCAALERSPFLGMVGPLLLYPEIDEVQHCGVSISPTRELGHIYASFPAAHRAPRKQRPLQAITGAAILLPARLFRACGCFYEGYLNGYEDLDLCCAIRREGLHLACVAKSVIYHLTSQTPGRFDNDTPNAALLSERWPNAFKPDAHIILKEDGYIPLLCPDLSLSGHLPHEKEMALTQAFARHFDVQRCLARLHAEPLWQGGYVLLAQHLEAQGQWQEACRVRTRLIRFFPSTEHALALTKTAGRCGEPEIAEQAAIIAQELQPAGAQQEVRTAKAMLLAKRAKEEEDHARAQLFHDWLAAYGC